VYGGGGEDHHAGRHLHQPVDDALGVLPLDLARANHGTRYLMCVDVCC